MLGSATKRGGRDRADQLPMGARRGPVAEHELARRQACAFRSTAKGSPLRRIVPAALGPGDQCRGRGRARAARSTTPSTGTASRSSATEIALAALALEELAGAVVRIDDPAETRIGWSRTPGLFSHEATAEQRPATARAA